MAELNQSLNGAWSIAMDSNADNVVEQLRGITLAIVGLAEQLADQEAKK